MKEGQEVSEREMDIAAVLDVYVYTDQKDKKYNNQTLATIVDGSTDEYCQSVKAITDNNPRIANMELLDQSSVSQPDAPYINNDYITACTFRDPETNDIYVCFCGTRDGQWIDDGEALVNENSVMQEEAVKYFDYIYEKYGDYGGKIIVTGHSKGGNEAQYVTLHSKYADQIDLCLSYDGQGMSERGVDAIIQEKGQEFFDEQCEKMYSICGDSDPVHDQGWVIIPREHTYFVETDFSLWPTNIVDCHDLRGMLDEDGINWSRDADGNIISAEERYFSEYGRRLSENLKQLPDEEYEDCTIALMFIVEFATAEKRTGVGERKCATREEVWGFLLVGGPEIIKTFFQTPEGRKAYFEALSILIPNPYTLPVAIWVSLLALALVLMGPKLESYTDVIEWALESILIVTEKLAVQYREVIYLMLETFAAFVNDRLGMNIWQCRGRQIICGGQIVIDTNKMRGYADRLEAVIDRLKRLDGDVCTFQKENFTNYAIKQLRKCTEWMNTTAEEFDAVENSLLTE